MNGIDRGTSRAEVGAVRFEYGGGSGAEIRAHLCVLHWEVKEDGWLRVQVGAGERGGRVGG